MKLWEGAQWGATQVRTALYSVKDTDPFLVFFSDRFGLGVQGGDLDTCARSRPTERSKSTGDNALSR